MSTHDTPWPAGTPCWADIAVPDMPKAVAFYSAVLGWDLVDSGEQFGGYHIAQVDGRAAAGIGHVMAEGQPTAWTLYIASDDADATAKLVTEHDGTLLFEPMEVPGSGRMCVAIDPTGGAFGIWQSLGMIGAGVVNEPGGMVWEDARLTDVDAGRRFFTDVFGWSYGDVPGVPAAEYGSFNLGGDPLGGIGGLMGAPAGTPSHWIVYFCSADVDASVAAVQQHGGGVVQPLEDTPFGRMGVMADLFGATFALIQLPA